MMTESDVQNIANEVLGDILGASGFDHAEVRLASDHDGDAAFFVTAHFKPGSGVTAGSVSTKAHTALWSQVLSHGDDRFPYLAFRYPDDELLLGEELAER